MESLTLSVLVMDIAFTTGKIHIQHYIHTLLIRQRNSSKNTLTTMIAMVFILFMAINNDLMTMNTEPKI